MIKLAIKQNQTSIMVLNINLMLSLICKNKKWHKIKCLIKKKRKL